MLRDPLFRRTEQQYLCGETGTRDRGLGACEPVVASRPGCKAGAGNRAGWARSGLVHRFRTPEPDERMSMNCCAPLG
ncbi:MAG: hypothetical protein AW07_00875 [Candidatus Accumulibacter sp. SK-11]|nr:MAG: hypothetical protein AW07_00875 [Candidatus Accumulibacter sp. SK-11]